MKLKLFIGLALFLVADTAAQNPNKCYARSADIPRDFLDMSIGCKKEVRRQIQEEINASMQYLAMGAHFSQSTINLPGFADFFFKAAAEEREHATKLIEYLLMRGQLTDDVSTLIDVKSPPTVSWDRGVDALKQALQTEAKVTKSIKHVIASCENDSHDHTNDYHLADFLTADFLKEQYTGQRDLAGKISTLEGLVRQQGNFGEFLFDKTILA